MKKFCFFILILFFTKNTFAVEFQGKFIQGHFIIGKTESGTKVLIDKKEVRTSDDGYFVFGIGFRFSYYKMTLYKFTPKFNSKSTFGKK